MLKTFNMDPGDMKEVIDELMAKFDTDGDGGVSYNEFAEFVKPKNVVDLTNVADHNNRGVGYFDAEHAAKIKKAAPLKPVKEATAAELEEYRAKLAEKIGTKYKLLTRAVPRHRHRPLGLFVQAGDRRRRGQLQPRCERTLWLDPPSSHRPLPALLPPSHRPPTPLVQASR